MIVGNHRINPRLLEHDLAHPDRVRVLGAPPGEIPAMLQIPPQNRRAEGMGPRLPQSAPHAWPPHASSAARCPLHTAPSIVGGSPVSVQSPARKRPSIAVLVL